MENLPEETKVQDTAWNNFNEYLKENDERSELGRTGREARDAFIDYLQKNHEHAKNSKYTDSIVFELSEFLREGFNNLIGYMRHQENNTMWREAYANIKNSLLWAEFVGGLDSLSITRAFKCRTLLTAIKHANREFMCKNVNRDRVDELRNKQREISNNHEQEYRDLIKYYKTVQITKGYKKLSDCEGIHREEKALQDKYNKLNKPLSDELKSFLDVGPATREDIEKVKGEFQKIIDPYKEMLKEAILSGETVSLEPPDETPIQRLDRVLRKHRADKWDKPKLAGLLQIVRKTHEYNTHWGELTKTYGVTTHNANYYFTRSTPPQNPISKFRDIFKELEITNGNNLYIERYLKAIEIKKKKAKKK